MGVVMVMHDLICQAAEATNFIRTNSCCGIGDKYCNTDEWKGNLEGFAEHLILLYEINKHQLPQKES
jgi:hypothetical protein